MSNINGAEIKSTSGGPYLWFYVTAVTSRISNSDVNVTFRVKARLNSSADFLGSGHQRNAAFTIGGTTKSVTVKTNGESWSGSAAWHTEYTLDFGTVSSSWAGDIDISFSVNSSGSNANPSTAGTMSATTFQLTMPPLLTTACGAPTWIGAGPDPFEGSMSLSWGGASGGINNGINVYYIEYQVSPNGWDWWGWTNEPAWRNPAGWATGITLDNGGFAVIALSRGYYVRFRIRAEGTAGSSYYSGFTESNTIHKNRAPYTPDWIAASPSPFEVSLTVSWAGSSDPDGNFNRYEVEYRTFDGSNWGGWAGLYYGTNTSAGHTPPINDGQYIQYRVRCTDTMGVASDYRYTDSILRDDGAGFNITIGGVNYKAKAYVSVGGVVYKGKPFVSVNGTVNKGIS